MSFFEKLMWKGKLEIVVKLYYELKMYLEIEFNSVWLVGYFCLSVIFDIFVFISK